MPVAALRRITASAALPAGYLTDQACEAPATPVGAVLTAKLFSTNGLTRRWTRERRCSGPVQWADHSQPTTVEHVGVNLRGLHIGMTEQLLHRANVLAAFQQVSGKGVAQGVRGGQLMNFSRADCRLEGPLD